MKLTTNRVSNECYRLTNVVDLDKHQHLVKFIGKKGYLVLDGGQNERKTILVPMFVNGELVAIHHLPCSLFKMEYEELCTPLDCRKYNKGLR